MKKLLIFDRGVFSCGLFVVVCFNQCIGKGIKFWTSSSLSGARLILTFSAPLTAPDAASFCRIRQLQVRSIRHRTYRRSRQRRKFCRSDRHLQDHRKNQDLHQEALLRHKCTDKRRRCRRQRSLRDLLGKFLQLKPQRPFFKFLSDDVGNVFIIAGDRRKNNFCCCHVKTLFHLN